MAAAVLAATVPDPLAMLVGIILVVALPIGVGMGVGWLLSLPARLRRTQTLPPADLQPSNPKRKPGRKK